MIRRLLLCILTFLFSGLFLSVSADSPVDIKAVFPYSLTEGSKAKVTAGSTQLLYLALQHANRPEELAQVKIELPEGYTAAAGSPWTVSPDGRHLQRDWVLPADYGQIFDSFSVKSDESLSAGTNIVKITVSGDGWKAEKTISFSVQPAGAGDSSAQSIKKQIGWYIQGITVPVDRDGKKDERQARNTLYVRDTMLENLRNRLLGDGGTDWNAVRAEPVTYVLLELRNPKKDIRSLHFKAELIDKETGQPVKGLVSANALDGGSGWTGNGGMATEATISLDGKTVQAAVIPLFADPYEIEEGDYNLRTAVWDDSSSKTAETPMTVVKKRNFGIASVAFAMLCAAGIFLALPKLRNCMKAIGAGGDIAVALFASLAFGGIVVPVTLLGDLFHVILGPFAGLVTGLLSGVLQYLLLMALLVLFRKPGTLSLFFLVKWLLAGMLFGRFTPVAVLNYAVYIGILETVLYVSGFYRKQTISVSYSLLISLLMGISDMAITCINLQQLMFFYRLYYADWFIGLYMVVNGLVYSSIGSWLGIRIGKRLQQVMGQ